MMRRNVKARKDIATFRRKYIVKTGSVGTTWVENNKQEEWELAADQIKRHGNPS